MSRMFSCDSSPLLGALLHQRRELATGSMSALRGAHHLSVCPFLWWVRVGVWLKRTQERYRKSAVNPTLQEVGNESMV